MKQHHYLLNFTIKTILRGGLIIALLSGCADSVKQQKLAIEQVRAPFAASAITINLIAQPQLNMWKFLPNSCTVLVIQAENNAALIKITEDPVQLKSLFNGAGSVVEILQVDRYTVMPGQQNTLHIDRAEKTRNIAFVAGYYPFPTKNDMAYYPIPVVTDSYGWFSKQWLATLMPLNIEITLGANSLLREDTVSRDMHDTNRILLQEQALQ